MMEWDQIVKKITPYVVMIETPSGHGTGFLCVWSEDRQFCGLATAYHVVAHADDWQQPIRIHHHASNTSIFLKEDRRVILADRWRDSAVILTDPGDLKLPEALIPLLPVDNILPIGTEVGWIGYPGMIRHTQCFFSGNVSAFQDGRHAYLIDGVAINGVSGGPVMYATSTEGIQIIGSISAYIANRLTGEALPGLSVVQDVSHLHEIAKQVKNLDEARRKQAEEAAKQQKIEQEKAAGAQDSGPPPATETIARSTEIANFGSPRRPNVRRPRPSKTRQG
jgi:hypothetical protein